MFKLIITVIDVAVPVNARDGESFVTRAVRSALRGEMGSSAGVAVWRQIADTLDGEIRSGVYPPGSKLPTEMQLAARFAVNRHTVRRAVGTLVDQGRVRVEQGRGSFVQEDVLDYPVGLRTRFSQNVLAAHRLPDRRLIRLDVVPAPAEVAEALAIASGEPVIVYESVSTADGREMSFGTSYFPAERFEGMDKVLTRSDSVTRALAAMGVTDYVRVSTRITAAMPTHDVARHLRMPVNRPILQTNSVNADLQGRPVEYCIGRFPADRLQFSVEPSRQAQP